MELLMGNEAIALGALAAGVQLVCGYPGTPSTEVLETVAKRRPEGVYVEWSVNEKAALEVAAGAALAGARAMVTMKQVGLNVASDPLMSLNYLGVEGGALVVLVADDPGPISSQTEQDTRHFGRYARIPVFDPQTPEQAYQMAKDAFACSEKWKRPVILRPTTRVCHSCASVAAEPPAAPRGVRGFAKSEKWVIFPRLAYAAKERLVVEEEALAEEFSRYAGNRLYGEGRLGIAMGGVAAAYAREAGFPARYLEIATPYPFPEELALSFLREVDAVLALEELDPVIEDALTRLCGKHHLPVRILGKHTGHVPVAGELSVESVRAAMAAFLGQEEQKAAAPAPLEGKLPVRPPVLCAGCPHRGSFYAVKQAMKGQKAVFCGDIGCYTLGNAAPLNMVDTCLCMGASVTMAQGIARMEKDTTAFAFIGDSTFFHTGIPGVVNAIYNGADEVIVVLDNSTTAMTGRQPHPGTGATMMGRAGQAHVYLQGAGRPGRARVARERLRFAGGQGGHRTGRRAARLRARGGAGGPCVSLVKGAAAYGGSRGLSKPAAAAARTGLPRAVHARGKGANRCFAVHGLHAVPASLPCELPEGRRWP